MPDGCSACSRSRPPPRRGRAGPVGAIARTSGASPPAPSRSSARRSLRRRQIPTRLDAEAEAFGTAFRLLEAKRGGERDHRAVVGAQLGLGIEDTKAARRRFLVERG